jgi:GNAT superfamily N-acetyltransferase
MPVWVREAGEDDVELLFDIRTSVRENHQSREELASLGITAESVARMLATEAKAWIRGIDSQAVGFAMANQYDRTVFALFVRPEHEGRGAGRALLKASEQWLFGRGLSDIWLSTGRDPTLRAHGFYRRMGWQPSGSSEDGSIIYTRHLARPSKMGTVELEAVPSSPMSHERAASAAQPTWEDLVPATNQISDKGLAVFAFAYHQLQSGHTVREVVASDGAGHGADPEAIRELEELGLTARDGDRVSFTDQGEAVLGRVIETIRQAADG